MMKLSRLIPWFIVMLFWSTINGWAQDKEITSIAFKGIEKNSKSFIDRLIKVKSGTIIDSSLLHSDITLLNRLPGVAHASFQVNDIAPNKVEVVYTIEEHFTFIPVLNFWTATNNRFAYKIGGYDYNFLGSAITLGGYYQNNGFDTYSLSFNAPYLFSKSLGLGVNYKLWRSEEPLYFENQTALYLYANKSIELLSFYEPSIHHRLRFGVSFFNEQYQYRSGNVPTAIPLELDIDKTLFKTVYDYNHLQYEYQDVSGARAVLNAQAVFSENNFQEHFLIAWSDLFYFKRIGANGNWANRLRLGLSSNNESPFAPFALDNNLNIRGVGNLIDRGTGVVLLNSEYRHTLLDKNWLVIQSNVFIDVGSWRQPGGTFNDFVTLENASLYPGLGLRFMHKRIYNAVLRIDYGHGVLRNSGNGVVFGVGQYF